MFFFVVLASQFQDDDKLHLTLSTDGSYKIIAGSNPASITLTSAPAFLQADMMMHSTKDGTLKVGGEDIIMLGKLIVLF